jgi:hypothetical protein
MKDETHKEAIVAHLKIILWHMNDGGVKNSVVKRASCKSELRTQDLPNK